MNNYKDSLVALFYFLLIFSFASKASSNNIDLLIKNLSENKTSVLAGQKTFEQHCAGCHNKDLSGSVGFNLKDGEWIHGSKPSQILTNIQNGFSEGGMPGFAQILNLKEQREVVGYILSKREGFDNLSYKIYQLSDETDTQYNEQDLVSYGQLNNNIANFELPEIKHYVLEFSGDLYVPPSLSKEQQHYISAEDIKNLKIEVIINGQAITPQAWGSLQRWLLLPNKQQITFRFYSGTASNYAKNIALYITNSDNSIKLLPLSTKAKAILGNMKYEIKSDTNYLVQQKKIVKLPAYSIAVGSPQKINYAFNTRSCAINGLWLGDLLNVGPNIDERGKDGSIPLGDWVYHFPEQLIPQVSAQQRCQFIKYHINDSSPEFHFSVDNLTLSLVADFIQANKIIFNYQVLNNPEKLSTLSFTAPNKLVIKSAQAQLEQNKLHVDLTRYTNFSIEMVLSGDAK